ncbi:hypothetical protein OIU77_007273 [Salix suchowensis]|uniref:Secreted protein n=1 Tax=Salix suchowensis TaxID=1278906 RepID=A0ABQ9AGG8_9ROSI|nr:hypothetical protein OIU77_007273 [Salix suchowensis]
MKRRWWTLLRLLNSPSHSPLTADAGGLGISLCVMEAMRSTTKLPETMFEFVMVVLVCVCHVEFETSGLE